MKNFHILITIILLCFVFSKSLDAEVIKTTICKNGNLERYVSHRIFENDGAPCDVYYEKPFEGNYRKSEWEAKNEPELCHNKYTQFISKLKTMGWECKQRNLNFSPVLQIVFTKKMKGEIYTSSYQFIGDINDYFTLKNGTNKFLIESDYHSRMSIEINFTKQAKLENVEAWDGFSCPRPKEAIPKKSLVKWTVSKLEKVNNNHYKLHLNTPEFAIREEPNCISQPAFIGGLKWKNSILTLKSNVTNAKIYQKVKSGKYEVVQGVDVGTKFSAIHSNFDKKIIFLLKKPGFANCILTVTLPVINPDNHLCNMIKIQK